MAVSPKNNPNERFRCLTHFIFIHLGKYRVDTIAKKMGWSADTLYKKVRGERNWLFDDVPKLVDATGDTIFLEYFCKPCGYAVIPSIKDKSTAKMFMNMVNLMQSAIDENDDPKKNHGAPESKKRP